MVLLSQVRNVTKRIPMIAFRAGFKNHKSEKIETIAAVSGNVGVKSSGKVKGPAIDDWQLPLRYRRRPIDVKEIDAINSGGAF